MNKRTMSLIQEMLGAVILGVGLDYVGSMPGDASYLNALSIMPLVWLALRYGGATAVIAGVVVGFVQGILAGHLSDVTLLALVDVLPYTFVGLAGFFAKYTQKTLNNHRYSSTYLNIATGALVATVGVVGIRSLMEWLVAHDVNLNVNQTIVVVLLTWLVTAGVFCLVAPRYPQFIIPKRSKYLSRKETSKLLND